LEKVEQNVKAPDQRQLPSGGDATINALGYNL